MRQMIQMMYGTVKIFILFTGCTILFYYGIMWINQEYENYHRYDEPQGTAVKVSTVGEEEYKWFDRLKFFYHYGE